MSLEAGVRLEREKALHARGRVLDERKKIRRKIKGLVKGAACPRDETDESTRRSSGCGREAGRAAAGAGQDDVCWVRDSAEA